MTDKNIFKEMTKGLYVIDPMKNGFTHEIGVNNYDGNRNNRVLFTYNSNFIPKVDTEAVVKAMQGTWNKRLNPGAMEECVQVLKVISNKTYDNGFIPITIDEIDQLLTVLKKAQL